MSSRVYSLQSFIYRINYILRKYFYERKMDPKRRCQEDEDCLFLEHVLDKLYDFGHGPESKKKLKSQKKKKRKRCDEEEEKEEEESSVAENSSKDKSKQLETEQAGPSSQNQVEVIVFQDPRKKQNMKEPPAPPALSTPQEPEKTQSDQTEELNLEKARLEVHRFGITGFRKEQQRVFEQDRAIMLGARPPKRECVNYKILQQQIKEKKQKAKEDVQPDVKKKKKRRNEKDKKTASSGLGAAPTGQMGRFKNGMLILSSSEIQKIKGRK